MVNIDTLYYITDLSSDSKRKYLLEDESKEGLIDVVSNYFKKPLFKLYVKDGEKHLIEKKMDKFKFISHDYDLNFSLGDFLLQIERVGDL